MIGRSRAPRDIWSGVLFMAIGLAFIAVAMGYDLGTTRRMGPAYFPILVAGLLVLAGLVLALRGLTKSGPAIEAIVTRPLLLVVGATIAFAFLLPTVGLFIAAIVLILVCALAEPQAGWRPYVLLALGLAVFCSILFTQLLKLPIPVVGPALQSIWGS